MAYKVKDSDLEKGSLYSALIWFTRLETKNETHHDSRVKISQCKYHLRSRLRGVKATDATNETQSDTQSHVK